MLRPVVLLLLSALAAPAAAQAPSPALLDCAAEADDAVRLACYDKVVAGMSGAAKAIAAKREAETAKLNAKRAEEAAAAAKLKAEADAKAKEQAFGGERLNPGKGLEQVDSLETTVGDVFTAKDGFAVFLLANGQLWRQTAGMPLPPVKAGDVVKIERGAISGYRMTLVRQARTVNVKRVR